MGNWESETNTPLKVIERIAQSEDRLLAIQFFLFFSRFEYALKCLNRIKVDRKSNLISADWDGYAQSRESVWSMAKENQEFREALAFLDAAPLPIDQLARTASMLKNGIYRLSRRQTSVVPACTVGHFCPLWQRTTQREKAAIVTSIPAAPRHWVAKI